MLHRALQRQGVLFRPLQGDTACLLPGHRNAALCYYAAAQIQHLRAPQMMSWTYIDVTMPISNIPATWMCKNVLGACLPYVTSDAR